MRERLFILIGIVVFGASPRDAHATHPKFVQQVQAQYVPLNPYIYAVTPQYPAPVVPAADVNAILAADRELGRLRAALAENLALQVQAQGQQTARLQQALTVPAPVVQHQAVQPDCPKPDCHKPANLPEPAPAVGILPDDVRTLLGNKCNRCHDAVSLKGGLNLANPATITKDKRWKIWGMAHGGEMPPAPGQALTDSEVEILRRWAKSAE